MKILGIESSCDETGVAIYDGLNNQLLGHKLYSQIDLHQQYGGVVPELASRDHLKRIIPLIQSLLLETKTQKHEITAIAYTAGPGLVGALLIGACVAESLAYAWSIPTIPIHHMEGHLLAPMLENNTLNYPFLALLVSGGHTQLIQVQQQGKYKILGETLDDAVGEAFDKTAKIMGLGYPGGPKIEQLALQGQPDKFHFPRPMTNRPGLDFSFSGLKTAVLETVKKHELKDYPNIAYAFQDAIIDTLIIKIDRALKQTQYTTVVISGGVSANQNLRNKIAEKFNKNNIHVIFPKLEFCTDNGAMIAYAGYIRHKETQTHRQIKTYPRWNIEQF